ncbi:MAG: lysoplasmalogenase [Chlorobi bacterium]|nr:lysoplasmalogenase [Chlorobiota bacterium]
MIFIYIILSAIAVYAAQTGAAVLYKITKGIPVFSLLLFLLIFDFNSDYRFFIMAALFFSLAGDLFLLSEKRFLYGVAAFLVSHVFYFIAFLNETENFIFLSAVPIFLLTGSYFLIIKKSLKSKMVIPIAVYVTVISLMLWSAANLFFTSGNDNSPIIFLAAILFTISDSVLAWNKFVKKFKFAQLIILPTYYAAQLLFAVSVVLN